MFNSQPVTYSQRRAHRRKLERAQAAIISTITSHDKMAALVASQEMVSAYDALIRDCLKTAAWKSDNEFVTTLATLIVGYKRLLGSVEETQIPPELRRFFDTPGAISDAVKAAYEASQQKKKGE